MFYLTRVIGKYDQNSFSAQDYSILGQPRDMGSFIIMNLTEILYRAPLKIQSAKQNEARAKKCCDVIWIFRGALQIFSVDRKISYKATKKLAQIPKSRCLLSYRNTKKKPNFIRNIYNVLILQIFNIL